MNLYQSGPMGIASQEDFVAIAREMATKATPIYIRADDMDPATPESVQYRLAITINPKYSFGDHREKAFNHAAGAVYRHLDNIKQSTRHMLRMWDKPMRGRAATKYHDALQDAGHLMMVGVKSLLENTFTYLSDMGPLISLEPMERKALMPVTVWLEVTLGMVPCAAHRKRLSYHTRVYYAYWHHASNLVVKDYIQEKGK